MTAITALLSNCRDIMSWFLLSSNLICDVYDVTVFQHAFQCMQVMLYEIDILVLYIK